MADECEQVVSILREMRAENAARHEELRRRLEQIAQRLEGLERGYAPLRQLLMKRRARMLEMLS
jgi:hypothetical protein